MVRLWSFSSSMKEVPAPPKFILATVNTFALYKPDFPESRLSEFTFVVLMLLPRAAFSDQSFQVLLNIAITSPYIMNS